MTRSDRMLDDVQCKIRIYYFLPLPEATLLFYLNI